MRGPRLGLPTTSLHTLRLFLIACAAVALATFAGFGVWRWFDLHDDARADLHRTASVAQEHAQRVLDTNESLLQLVLTLTDGLDAAQVQARAGPLHAQLSALVKDRPQIQSIWVFGADGAALVGSRAAQPPAGFSVADRSYFAWHRDARGGVFASSVMHQRGDRFFNISRGRYDRAGRFLGVVTVAIFSNYFVQFHGELARAQPGLALALMRQDGMLYSRWPAMDKLPDRVSDDTVRRLRANAAHPEPTAVVTSVDGTERLASYRALAGYPVWILVARDLATIRGAWLGEMARIAGFAVLPFLLLAYFGYATVRSARRAMQVTERLEQEVAARRHAEEALLQAQKLEALGRLTGGVAHDFNNALMVISGNLHLLRRTATAKEERSLSAIGRAVESAGKLTRQLLAFTRRQALSPESVALQELLPRLADLFKPVLGDRIALRIDVDPATPPVLVDPAELELGLLNLAVNARDAMPRGGSFTVTAAPDRGGEPGHVVIAVGDTGEGMTPEVLRKAFDPFFTTKEVGRGTGLGLAQVQALCARAGGHAAIASEPGRGTTVTLSLPAAPAGAQEAAPPALRVAGKHVLVVEDNPDVAQAVVRMLEDLECRVTHFHDGGAALRYLERQPAPPDLLLTDLVMPNGMGGVELAAKVRERWPGVRLMYMTGYSDQIDRVAGTRDPVLPKPFTATLLARALGEALGQQEQREAEPAA